MKRLPALSAAREFHLKVRSQTPACSRQGVWERVLNLRDKVIE